MNPGELRHRVRIEEKVLTTGTTGADTVSWVERGTVWGAVLPLRGREYLEAYKATAPVDVRVVIRKPAIEVRPDVHRFVLNKSGQRYNIHAVIDNALRGALLECMCSTGSNDGR